MTRFTKHSHGNGRRQNTSMFDKLKESLRHSITGDTAHTPDAAEPQDTTGAPTTAPTQSGGVLEDLERHAIDLNPLVKRRIYSHLPGTPQGVSLGWAQLPQTHGRAFSLGMFIGDNRFTQVALADDRGRVFAGADPRMDIQAAEIRFMFGKDGESRLPDDTRLGTSPKAPAAAVTRLRDMLGMPDDGQGVDVIQGSVVGRGADGRMMWLASWIKRNNRYTLEQLRANLPQDMRCDLEYRDAIAIAFFASYLLPHINGLLVGFGSGNIFRRLNREAPIGAIRRSVRDTLESRAHGMRVSGLEDYFADVMRESGALQPVTGLEAVHGAEPLHLYTSSYSGSYFFSWDSSLEFSPALASLVIEGGLNRFAAVSAVLERNARVGQQPIEDNVTRAQAAQIDMALLDDPALIALRADDRTMLDPLHDDGVAPLRNIMRLARQADEQTAHDFPDPAAGHAAATDASGSEWVYRQTLALLLRSMRLPFRFDVEFRTNLADGNVALAFTTAGTAMMPKSKYSAASRDWVKLDEHERASMSAAYNLRVGLMMAAIAFSADPQVRQVTVYIDSIGLEEAVAEQDSAITKLMGEALKAFERMRSQDAGTVMGGKAAPKDGDIHGDPSLASSMRGETPHDGATHPAQEASAPAGGHQTAGEDDEAGTPADVDREFEDLMHGADIDETAFSVSPDNSGNSEGKEIFTIGDDTAGKADGHGPDDPLSALRSNPTVRHMAAVTFQRDAFLKRVREHGLNDPIATYRMFEAVMDVDEDGSLHPVNADFDLRDAKFSPLAAQQEPEFSETGFPPSASRILGCEDATGLSIQRVDLLQRAVTDFHRLAADGAMPTVAKAQQAMRIVDRIGDPELSELAPQATAALIDGNDTPDFDFTLSKQLDDDRVKARDLFFSGQAEQAVELQESAVDKLDARYAQSNGVPRYFNSYAERVVYNRLFATAGERTVLIPDNLFYAHMELADILSQLKGVKAALPHLNAMVSYAPAYPLSHMKLAVQLARDEDWDSARAACLNALRVALDRDDAAFAYYRFAYAEWMHDRFDTAAAAYLMASHIAPGQIATLPAELEELTERARSQCIPVPHDVAQAAAVLAEHDLPVWPHTEVASIVRQAARLCVDQGMFVPARTLSIAAARLNDGPGDGIDMVQAQFLRSLSA
ncbi:tetratricopeptide repeat protein [Bifidobacterium thermophilum]|uniref:tetratricopeptide repeat protein n=1 Tax=Bifidobacterium thermophilum TaxID=33905 RepID=UPI00309A9BBD